MTANTRGSAAPDVSDNGQLPLLYQKTKPEDVKMTTSAVLFNVVAHDDEEEGCWSLFSEDRQKSL